MGRTMFSSTAPTLGSGRWAGDYLGREHLIPGGAKIDASQFNSDDAVVVDVGAAGAAQNAVSIPVTALSGPIPNGTILSWSATKFAKLTAAAAKGAVTLTVAAIPVALVDADVTTYPGIGPKYIPSGTVIGRTYTERDANTAFGVAGDADDEFYIVAFDIADANHVDDVELYKPNGMVYENFLPGWAGLSATVKGKIRDKYVCANGSV